MANIPYSGYNGNIATYSAYTCITITSVTDNASWMTVSSGNNVINGSVQENTTLSSRTATVTVGYKADTTDCSKSFTVTQDPRPCKCGDLKLNPTSLSWANNAVNAKNVTISADPSATCLTNFSVSSSTSHFSAGTNGNTIQIKPTSTNSTTSDINGIVTLSYKASSKNCSSAITLTHSAMGCECGMLTLSPTSLNWAYSATSADSSSVTIEKDSCITAVSVPQGTNFTTSFDNNNTITIRPKGKNTSANELREVIVVSYSAGTTPCSSAITLTQESSGACNCNSVTFTKIKDTIGSGGTSSTGTAIQRYNFNGCAGEIVSGTTDVTWLKYLNANNNRIYVSAQTNTALGNERSGVTTVCYKANSTDSELCYKSFIVKQLSVPCSCDALNYFITPIRTVFGSGGTHGNMVLIASGDTRGCGSLSAQTTSLWFGDEQGHSGASIITQYVEGSDNEQAYFYLNVLPYTSDWPLRNERSAQSQIFFIPKDPEMEMCSGHSFSVTQYESRKVLAQCDEIIVSSSAVTFDCDANTWYNGNNARIVELTRVYDGDTTLYDSTNYFRMSGYSDSDWIETRNYTDTTKPYLWAFPVYPNVNSTSSARTATVNYIVSRIESGVTVSCYTSSVTVTQEGCNEAIDCSGCSEYYIDASSLSYDLGYVSNSGKSVDVRDYVVGYSFCQITNPSDLNFSLDIPPSASTYITYDPSTYILTVTANSQDEPREFSFGIKITYDGYDCTSEEMVSVRQYAGCRCNTYWDGPNITTDYQARYVDLSFHDTGGQYINIDAVRRCGNGVSANTNDSAITAITSGSTSARVYITENDTGSERTITGFLQVVQYISDLDIWTPVCSKPFTITQAARIDCNCSVEVRSTGWEAYYNQSEVVGYIDFAHSGSCISGYSLEVESQYSSITSVYPTEYHDPDSDTHYVTVRAINNMPQIGCESVDIYVKVYDSDGEVCSGGTITAVLNTGCKYTAPSYGTLTSAGASIPSTTTGAVIGTITSSEVGSGDYLCYSFIGVDQGGYLTNIRFEETSRSGSYINYNIVADCTGQIGGPFDVNINVQKSNVCGSGREISLGTIQVTVTSN